jgi:hypothetical protein
MYMPAGMLESQSDSPNIPLVGVGIIIISLHIGVRSINPNVERDNYDTNEPTSGM